MNKACRFFLFSPEKTNYHRISICAVHIVLPLLLSILAFTGSLYRVYTFETNDFDYGLFSNLLWNFSHGNGWMLSLYTGEVRVNFLADHFALIIPLFSSFFYLFPSPYTLSVLHGSAFAATFFLAPFLVREIWRDAGREDYLKASLFLLLALSVFKGFTGPWRFQAHMTTLVMPFLLCALIALHRKALIWTVFWCVLVAMAQERAVPAVFGVGMYAIGITKNPRLGGALCVGAAAYFVAIVKFIIPSFYTAVGGYLYQNHVHLLFDLKKKATFVVNMTLYWFFLPLVGRRACIATACSLTVLGIGLVSNRASMYSFGHQYQDLPSVFLFAAATHGLLWVTSQDWFLRIPRYAILAFAFGALAFSANFSWHSLPFKIVIGMKDSPVVQQLNHDLEPFREIPAEIFVFATSGVGPRFALREHRYRLSMERAEEHFVSSMVFVAPNISLYPYESAGALLQALDANASLNLIKDTEELRVYMSRDLPTTFGAIKRE